MVEVSAQTEAQFRSMRKATGHGDWWLVVEIYECVECHALVADRIGHRLFHEADDRRGRRIESIIDVLDLHLTDDHGKGADAVHLRDDNPPTSSGGVQE